MKKANGVFIGAYPKNGIYEIMQIPENEKPFMKFIVDARRSINNAIRKAVPGESGALASALIIIAVVITDVRFLIGLNNRKKLRLVLILQSCATIFICFVSWNYSVQIINYLYHLL
jgi:hypothetical protein